MVNPPTFLHNLWCEIIIGTLTKLLTVLEGGGVAVCPFRFSFHWKLKGDICLWCYAGIVGRARLLTRTHVSYQTSLRSIMQEVLQPYLCVLGFSQRCCVLE